MENVGTLQPHSGPPLPQRVSGQMRGRSAFSADALQRDSGTPGRKRGQKSIPGRISRFFFFLQAYPVVFGIIDPGILKDGF